MKLKRLKVYYTQARMMLQDVLIYRADSVSRTLAWGIRFLISAYLWIAIVGSETGEIAGYNLKTALTYFLLMQIVTSVIFTTVGFRVSDDIQSGDLSSQLILPADYLMLRLSQDLGRIGFFLMTNLILYLGIAFIFKSYFDLSFGIGFIALGAFSAALAFIMNFSINAAIGMLAFWITSSRRLIFHFFALITLASGMILPLEFFPLIVQKILLLTPFPYLFYFPVHIIQSETFDASLQTGLMVQGAYALALLGIMYFMFNRGVRTYEAVGR